MAEPISATNTGEARATASNYQAGNEADFERLYQASYGKILGTLTAMLGDRAAAEDCAQDAFERAYKKWATWQPIAPAEAWVHRIAINAAVSYQRKMRLREVGEVIRRLGRPGLAPDPQEIVEHRDLAIALSKLPPKQAAGDRAAPLPRLHQPGHRAGPRHSRAHGGLSTSGREGAAARDAEALVRSGGGARGERRGAELRRRGLTPRAIPHVWRQPCPIAR